MITLLHGDLQSVGLLTTYVWEPPWCFCDKEENISAGNAVSGRGPTVQMTACPKRRRPGDSEPQGRVRDQIIQVWVLLVYSTLW